MLERRFYPARVERREATKDSPATLVGTAVVWNSLSHDLGGFRERVLRNSFAATLRGGNEVKCTFNHNNDLALGRQKNGTLSLSDEVSGLRFAVALPNTSAGRDVAALVARGDANQCSFSFQCDSESWSDETDPQDPSATIAVRTIHAAKLFTVDVVVNPAYESSSVQLSSVADGTSPLYGISSMPHGAMRQFFPEGIPVEVRAHVQTSKSPSNELAAANRRRLLDFAINL